MKLSQVVDEEGEQHLARLRNERDRLAALEQPEKDAAAEEASRGIEEPSILTPCLLSAL